MAQKLDLIDQAIADCNSAITLDDRYIRAYQRRAKLWATNVSANVSIIVVTSKTSSTRNASMTGRKCANSRAIRRTGKHSRMQRDSSNWVRERTITRSWEWTSRPLKVTSRRRIGSRPCYTILVCDTHYYSLYRPLFTDRHASAEQEVKEKEEQTFKEVSEAYSVLSDERKRERYDNGHNIEEMGMGKWCHCVSDSPVVVSCRHQSFRSLLYNVCRRHAIWVWRGCIWYSTWRGWG